MPPDMPSPGSTVVAAAATFGGSEPVQDRSSPRIAFPLVLVLGLALLVVLAGAGAGLHASAPRMPVTVHVDGKLLDIQMRRGTVRSALELAGIRLGPQDRVFPGLATPLTAGQRIQVQRAVVLTVFADGQIHQMETAAPTVGAVLRRLRIPVDADDRVFPAPGVGVWSGMRARVVRVNKVLITERLPILAGSMTVRDATLPRGMVRVSEGRPGYKIRTFQQTFADGDLRRSVYLGEKVALEPTPTTTRIGTRILMASRGAFAGHEYMTVVATAYAPWHGKGVDGTTAIGLRAGYGVIAVDPKVIPLRSRLYIEGYGYAIAGDTGGRIKGLRIDLGMDTVRSARQWGRRPVRVFIIERGVRRR